MPPLAGFGVGSGLALVDPVDPNRLGGRNCQERDFLAGLR